MVWTEHGGHALADVCCAFTLALTVIVTAAVRVGQEERLPYNQGGAGEEWVLPHGD